MQTWLWLSTILILFVFVLAFFLLEFPLLWRTLKIRKLCRELRTANGHENERRSQISSRLRSRKWLIVPISRFEKVWRGSFSEDLRYAVGDFEFSSFIAARELLPGFAKHRRLAHAMPGILVAAGILGTFIGLVFSLPALAEIEGQDSLRNLISPVLAGMRLAFSTSIVGISTSILFIVGDRIVAQNLERLIDELSDLVSEAYPFITQSEAWARQLEQVEEGVENLRTMGTDLATALTEQLGPALDQSITQHLKPIMERLEQTVGGRQTEGMQQLVDGFINSMNSAMGHQFTSLSDILEATVESQTRIREGLVARTGRRGRRELAHYGD